MVAAQQRFGWRAALAAAALAFAGAACGGSGGAEAQGPAATGAAPAATEPDAHVYRLEAPRELTTRDNAFRVSWLPEGGVVPINEHFSVDVTLTRNDEARTPVTGAEVTMSCFMPDHGHGMLREPRSKELGDGRYQVNGFLLHMDGYWTVSVNVLVEGLAASAEDELRL